MCHFLSPDYFSGLLTQLCRDLQLRKQLRLHSALDLLVQLLALWLPFLPEITDEGLQEQSELACVHAARLQDSSVQALAFYKDLREVRKGNPLRHGRNRGFAACLSRLPTPPAGKHVSSRFSSASRAQLWEQR